jgi:glycine cleavage system H protein
MGFVSGCEFPEGLWYQVEQDVWVQPGPDGTVRIGMTDPAQTRAGKVLHVHVREGKRVAAGKSLATVESGKWVGPVPTPFPALVVASNPRLADDPAVINQDPYGEGWLAVLQPEVGPDTWAAWGLVEGPSVSEQYRPKLEAAGIACIRCQDTAP